MDLEHKRCFNSKGSRIGVILMTPKEPIIGQSYTVGFPATNNEAEYEAVIVGLWMAVTLGVTGLEVYCDSLLMVSQINGEYAVKDDRMVEYLQIVLSLKSKFLHCNFKQVPVGEQPC